VKNRLLIGLATGGLMAAMLPGVATVAQDDTWTVVADGIDAPRGLTFAPDGTLYVAIAGGGGDECMEAPSPETGELMEMCMGPSGSISAVDVATGTVTPVVGGLLSVHSPADGVIGPPDVAVGADGDVFYLTADGAVPDAPERAEGDAGAIVWHVAADGSSEQLADLIAFEAAENPDGGQLDSNPNGLTIAPDGTIIVADAGANALLMIGADGAINVAAVFPDTMTEMPAMPDAPEPEAGAEPQMIPMQAVPTSVTLDPDGAAYVTFLRGFPFTPGSAMVARVVEGEEPTVYAEGFTNVIDAAFASDGTLYVLEIFTNSMLSGDPTGALWSVPPGGGTPTLVTSDGLITPGGIAIDKDDGIYVSNGSAQPGAGAIVKLNQ
jgi:sugar lactone lactonase YvrE